MRGQSEPAPYSSLCGTEQGRIKGFGETVRLWACATKFTTGGPSTVKYYMRRWDAICEKSVRAGPIVARDRTVADRT